MSGNRLNDISTHNRDRYAILYQEGDEEALSYFYTEFHPALSLYANSFLQNRELAEEIASDAFIKTWKHHEKLDSYNAIRAYLYKTVYNAAILAGKRHKRKTSLESGAQLVEVHNENPLDDLIRAESYRLVYSALEDLAPGNQKVIKMYYLEGKSSGEIARELKLSRSTVNSHKYQGLAALRKKLLQLFLQ